jgi:hypothetical protein
MKNGCGYSNEQWGVGVFFQKEPPFENSRFATDRLQAAMTISPNLQFHRKKHHLKPTVWLPKDKSCQKKPLRASFVHP